MTNGVRYFREGGCIVIRTIVVPIVWGGILIVVEDFGHLMFVSKRV